ncbi:PRELI domain-containing protein 1, mitochondrial [Hyaloraphidium curvatum]|nr:PRELI domain-containing protein 1, mitochondrial [Hyaloraphidium curvatum]
MPQRFSTSYEYGHPWALVTRGVWAKYPNPQASHVLSADVLDRRVAADGSLHTLRLLVKTNHMPAWGAALFKVAMHGYILEQSVVDPRTRTMTTTTKNITHTTLMEVTEWSTLRPDDSGSGTRVDVEALVSCTLRTGGSFLRSRVEAFGVQRFEKNVGKARVGMEWVLARLEGQQADEEAERGRKALLKKVKDRVVLAGERVGERVERVAERVGDRVERAAERVGEKVERAAGRAAEALPVAKPAAEGVPR